MAYPALNVRVGAKGFQSVPLADRIAMYSRQNGECIEWTGARVSTGYGKIHHNGKMCAAHRVNYEMLVGPIPIGLHLDHLCRNRCCINPAHLEPVTPRENTLRSPIAVTAENMRKTHCLRGHEFNAGNIIPNVRGERMCRACHRERDRQYRARRLAKTGEMA